MFSLYLITIKITFSIFFYDFNHAKALLSLDDANEVRIFFKLSFYGFPNSTNIDVIVLGSSKHS